MSAVREWFPIRWRATVVVAAALLATAPFAAADGPVAVTFQTSGDEVPGGTVTVAATIEITDGSTLQGLSWSQVAGAAATLSGAETASVAATLAPLAAYREQLIHVLSEPPIGADQLPPTVPLPPGEFPGGLQDRFQVVGVNPFALEHAAAVVLELAVTTSSGTYHAETEVHVPLPWQPANGILNVPIGRPVLLHGKAQTAYDWALTTPEGSVAVLVDGASQNPEFTPDLSGNYRVTVTNEASGTQVSLAIYAGTWRGIIVGQDADGRPVADQACTTCHNGTFAAAVFPEWAQTGHAEIFSDSLNTNNHYSANCFACHTVGYDPGAANNGIDDQADYQAFVDSGLIHDTTGTEWTQMLDQFPASAKLGNVQCESCHGPQDSNAHSLSQARGSLSSDMCATCHGEPLRHGRFQQWQLSAHANYEVAIDEGSNGTCAKCHTANGFLAWLPILTGEVPGDPNASVPVTWSEDEIHPQTCQTCHDPHMSGTTSGNDPNATVRISGDTPLLMAGFVAEDVGRGAICMTCHNTRRGLKNDTTFGSDLERAPHVGAQADVLMGQNAYFVEVGQRAFHARLEDSCVTCHMESTPPPDELSYNQGGTNHTFYASPDICADCHALVRAEDVQGPFEAKLEELKHAIEGTIMDLIERQLAAGRTVALGSAATITNAADVVGIDFTEASGRQAISVAFRDGSEVGPTSLNNVRVRGGSGSSFTLYSVADESLPKAGWNYFLLHSDASHGVHNPSWSSSVADLSLFALRTAGGGGGGVGPGGGGGIHPGDGTGGVACSDGFVYWTEIATAGDGLEGSTWRTDLVTRNTAAEPAELDLVFHTAGGDIAGMATLDPGTQGVFEDVVSMMGGADKGTLEICSDQPLEVIERIYNLSETGTYGQFIDGFPGGSGLMTGASARLLGLRQASGTFRTNISVSNTGTDEAEVAVTLFSTAGAELVSYTLTVGSGMVVQDIEPFKSRAGQPDLGWGFAIVEVLSGEGVVASASVIDSRTNDGTTIPMKL